MITLDAAIKISQVAIEEGRKRGVPNMAVAVVDAGGALRLALRTDGQGFFGIDIARGKAVSALGFNRATLQLAQMFSDPVKVAGIVAATGGQFVPIGGGVLVQNEAGVTLGAAAVAGGMPEVDEAIVSAGVLAAGLFVPK